MTTNTLAQPFFEFLSSHDLSLYKVAKTAEISEGTLRYFRDIEGRQLNWQTRQAVIRALRQLTNESINIVSLFGTPEEKAEVRNFYLDRPAPNTKFADALCKNGFSEKSFSDITGIDEVIVSSLLNNQRIDIVGAKQIADVLGEPLQGIGYISSRADTSHENELVEHGGDAALGAIDLPRNLPIREINKRDNGSLYVTGRIIGYTVRPPTLIGNIDAYALYIPNSDMAPRLRKGDIIYVDPHWPVIPMSDVVVHIKSGDDLGNILIAALTLRNDDRYAFTFYKSSETYVFDENEIEMHKILYGQDLIIR